MISRISRFLMPGHQDGDQQLSVTAKFFLQVAMPTPGTPGFELASGNAIKLLLGLRHLAAADQHWAECEEVGTLSGLTSSTAVYRALNELRDLEWVRAHPVGEYGFPFKLLEPPAALSPRATKRYANKIPKLRYRPNAREL